MLSRAIVILFCFAGGFGLITRNEQVEAVAPRASFSQFPMQIDEWRGVTEPPFDNEVLAILGVDDYLTRAYFTPDRAGVGLYIGYYSSQRQGDTMHSPLNCLPGSGWEPQSKATTRIDVGQSAADQLSREVEVNRYVVQKGLDRELVLYWYQSRGRVVASEYWSKFYLIHDAIRLHRTDGALVRVITPVAADDVGEAQAERRAISFVKKMFPVLPSYLPG